MATPKRSKPPAKRKGQASPAGKGTGAKVVHQGRVTKRLRPTYNRDFRPFLDAWCESWVAHKYAGELWFAPREYEDFLQCFWSRGLSPSRILANLHRAIHTPVRLDLRWDAFVDCCVEDLKSGVALDVPALTERERCYSNGVVETLGLSIDDEIHYLMSDAPGRRRGRRILFNVEVWEIFEDPDCGGSLGDWPGGDVTDPAVDRFLAEGVPLSHLVVALDWAAKTHVVPADQKWDCYLWHVPILDRWWYQQLRGNLPVFPYDKATETFEQLYLAGLSSEECVRLIDVVAGKTLDTMAAKWRYWCKCCWNAVKWGQGLRWEGGDE